MQTRGPVAAAEHRALERQALAVGKLEAEEALAADLDLRASRACRGARPVPAVCPPPHCCWPLPLDAQADLGRLLLRVALEGAAHGRGVARVAPDRDGDVERR